MISRRLRRVAPFYLWIGGDLMIDSSDKFVRIHAIKRNCCMVRYNQPKVYVSWAVRLMISS